MKFLLTAVNAKYIHSNPAIYSLKAYADQYRPHGDWEVELAEYTINHEKQAILREIYKRKPDAVGFSCYIWNIAVIRELISDLKKLLPRVPIWLGGPEVSFDLEKQLRNIPEVSGIMYGEGEQTFLELLTWYQNRTGEREAAGKKGSGETDGENEDGGLEVIRGIAWRKKDQTIRINPARTVMNLTQVPFLYRDLSGWKNRIIYYETSRGCPYRCSYCLSSVDKTVRFRELSVVKKELDFFLSQKPSQVKLVDRTFNAGRVHGLAIWKYLSEHDNGVTNFHFEVSADLIGEEELDVMRRMRPGLIQLEIGVQTTNEKTANAICRSASFEKISRVVKRIKTFGNIHQHLDLIAGLPYEDYESFSHSFDDVYALQPDQLQLGFLKVLCGSPIYDQRETFGIAYGSQPPYEVLYTKWLSYDDVIRLKGVEEMVEVYYNSGQFSASMNCLARFFDRPFHLYERLAQYYEAHHLFDISHSRLKRYEILNDFAREETLVDAWVFAQVLTYDAYLRENMKNRPSFARSQDRWKEEKKQWSMRETAEHRILSGYEQVSSRQLLNMVHVEVFEMDMDRFMEDGTVVRTEQWKVFDYQKRDPLHKGAAVFSVW